MKIMVTGANGQVGTEIIKMFTSSEHTIVACTRKQLDCTQLEQVNAVLDDIEPELIINTAAYTAVDNAEDEPQLAHIVNAEFVYQLVHYCTSHNVPLIHLSTDYVFDGVKGASYNEKDIPHPLNTYGYTKWDGEQAILYQLKKHIILRVSWVFGEYGKNFVKTMLNLATTKKELNIIADQWGRPTAARDLARVLFVIVQNISQLSFAGWGIYHYAGQGPTNWYAFAAVLLNMAKEQGLPVMLNNLQPIKSQDYVTKAVRPKNSILDTTKIERILGIQCHSWDKYLPDMIKNFTKSYENSHE